MTTGTNNRLRLAARHLYARWRRSSPVDHCEPHQENTRSLWNGGTGTVSETGTDRVDGHR